MNQRIQYYGPDGEKLPVIFGFRSYRSKKIDDVYKSVDKKELRGNVFYLFENSKGEKQTVTQEQMMRPIKDCSVCMGGCDCTPFPAIHLHTIYQNNIMYIEELKELVDEKETGEG